MPGYFEAFPKIRYEGGNSRNPLAFRHYNPDERLLDKTMKEHLRFSVAYWHSFAWGGTDPFGWPTLDRPWSGDGLEKAKLKADGCL